MSDDLHLKSQSQMMSRAVARACSFIITTAVPVLTFKTKHMPVLTFKTASQVIYEDDITSCLVEVVYENDFRSCLEEFSAAMLRDAIPGNTLVVADFRFPCASTDVYTSVYV